MTTELRDRLQSTLGDAYTLDRELGGGGMSRVFLSRETALGRRVVVKVLPPDLAAGVSVDRFKREIQLAAQLQHANIVPVLAAGESDGLPYYTMPYVEGDSLRARLAQGPLAIGEAVSVLRDVARALAYAHEHGVVHRDIKPDNVLLAGGAAVVTDFGIAKALAASKGDEADPGSQTGALTGLGTSLGTPAYMAPEQAAADPDADHRVDVYAFGCMAYELLAGRAPFAGLSPQRLLAAQMSQRPEPVRALRPDCPPGLAELVTRCLEKEPTARPQTASELLQTLDGARSGDHAAGPVIALANRRTLMTALALYGTSFLIVAMLARLAITAVGLPDWVYPAALVVMALGLPVVLFTGLVRHHSRAAHAVPTLTPGGSRHGASTVATLAARASPHVTWKRTAMGGGLAVSALALFTGGYMVLRAMGIGPAGSLMAAGVLGDRDRVIVADFASPATDTTLGGVVAEAFRTDLAQSRNLTVFQPAAVREVIRRMQRPANARVDAALAREVASREGLKAVIEGDVVALGGGYVLSARLMAAQSGAELAAFRETAASAQELIPAIGRLSKQVRARVGESLRTVQQTEPLERVSTGSLEALRRYVDATRAMSSGDAAGAERLLQDAVKLDTSFAMAYRRLGVQLQNRGGRAQDALNALQKAYDHRDRLSDLERHLTVGTYFWTGPQQDQDRALEAFEAALRIDSTNTTALIDAAVIHRNRRQWDRAVSLLERVTRVYETTGEPPNGTTYFNLALAQVAMGRVDDARRTVEGLARLAPGHAALTTGRANLAYLAGRADSSERLHRAALARARAGTGSIEGPSNLLATLATRRGRLAEARQLSRAAREVARARGVATAAIGDDLSEAMDDAWFRERSAEAVRRADAMLASPAFDSVPRIERPYGTLTILYSVAGRPDRARTMLSRYDSARANLRISASEASRQAYLGFIAQSEGRYADAITAFRSADEGTCTICTLPYLASAYDRAGNVDSAITVFERYVTTPMYGRQGLDATFLARTHERLGQLYEARGDRARAAHHYAALVDLWKDADPELQPRVREARERLARIQRSERP